MIVDWQSGQMQQELKDLFSGAALYADDRLYCLLEDGRCALLKLTPGGCDIASQFRLVPGKVRDAWAHPVLLDGRLYLRYHETLWCFDVRGS
jgi:hypothetical protein